MKIRKFAAFIMACVMAFTALNFTVFAAENKIGKLDIFDGISYGLNTRINATEKNGIPMYWEPVDNANCYYVYRKTSENGKLKLVKKTTEVKYIDQKIELGKRYWYAIVAVKLVNGKITAQSDKYEFYADATKFDTPKLTAKLDNTDTTNPFINLTWNETETSDYSKDKIMYYIYRKENEEDAFKLIKKTKKCLYTDNTVKAGKTYSYKVRIYETNELYNNTNDSITNEIVDISLPSKVVTLTVSNLPPITYTSAKIGTNSISLTWSNSGADRYYLYRSTEENGEYTCLGYTTKTSYTLKNLKAGTTYYFKAQPAKKVGKKLYRGEFTNVIYATMRAADGKWYDRNNKLISEDGKYLDGTNVPLYTPNMKEKLEKVTKELQSIATMVNKYIYGNGSLDIVKTQYLFSLEIYGSRYVILSTLCPDDYYTSSSSFSGWTGLDCLSKEDRTFRKWSDGNVFKYGEMKHTDITAFTPNLNSLTINYTTMESLPDISYLSKITNLDFRSNLLTDISSLNNVKSPINSLNLDNNLLADISTLAELKATQIGSDFGILLSYNNITDYTPLYNLKSLKFLSIGRIPAKDLKALKSHLPNCNFF